MYIVLQPDMADLSVSQAEAPGETINYNNEETVIYENIVVWFDALQESSCCSLQGFCPTSSWALRMTASVAFLLFRSGAMLFVGEAEPVGPSQQPEISASTVDFRGNF